VAQNPGSGSLDQVLRFLKLMALSSAYATEVANLIAAADPTTAGVLKYAVLDANGQSQNLDLIDNDYKDLTWISPSIAAAQITDGLRIEPPFPRLSLVAQPGSVLRDSKGNEFRADQGPIVGYQYVVDCILITVNGDPNAAFREAQIHAEALDRLIARNWFLGGLVRLIQSSGPGVPATAPYKGMGAVGGAHLRLTADVERQV
jgi:hypothetical protein